MIQIKESEWKRADADVFWGEISPCEHILQVYDDDEIFIESLTGFVGSGINAGDACIIIATESHLEVLNKRLTSHGINIHSLLAEDRYIPLVAEETLAKFMRNDWPDEALFNQTISQILKRARGDQKRNVRAFGEMVALLWAVGLNGATVQLEHLWNKFSEQESFCLFCAYPKIGFTGKPSESIGHICKSHEKMISGSEKQMSQVLYTNIHTPIHAPTPAVNGV